MQQLNYLKFIDLTQVISMYKNGIYLCTRVCCYLPPSDFHCLSTVKEICNASLQYHTAHKLLRKLTNWKMTVVIKTCQLVIKV